MKNTEITEKLSTKIFFNEQMNYIMYISVLLEDNEEKDTDIRVVDITQKCEIHLDDVWKYMWIEL